MLSHLRRLATTGFAYTGASVLSKVIAVLLLPLYTRYLSEADYGAAELIFTSVVTASIVIRFGLIEALLRFYYLPGERGTRVIASGFSALVWMTTAAALIALLFAEAIANALFGDTIAGAVLASGGTPELTAGEATELVRIGIAGLWLLTLAEYLISIYRLEERAAAYFFFTIANVVVAIPLTVWLVVIEDQGARGILLGSFGSGVPFVIALALSHRRRLALIPDRALLRRMLRFGVPTMPAELSLYSLQFIDRIIIVRFAGLAEAGLYALAFKFSQAIQVVVRGFQLAWPPLAYSVSDDDEARRIYATVLTAFTALAAFIVVGMWLEARWIVRILAAPKFFESFEAIGLLATGAALYGVYLTLVVILGRTGRTERSFPATIAGTIANVILNLLLVPPYGIVGAGVALVASYLVVIVMVHLFTRGLFVVPWQWGRLAVVVALAAALIGAGELLLPTDGALGLLSRAALWLTYPLILLFGGAVTRQQRSAIVALLSPKEVRRRLAELRAATAERPLSQATTDDPGTEVYEAELRDSDRGGF